MTTKYQVWCNAFKREMADQLQVPEKYLFGPIDSSPNWSASYKAFCSVREQHDGKLNRLSSDIINIWKECKNDR